MPVLGSTGSPRRRRTRPWPQARGSSTSVPPGSVPREGEIPGAVIVERNHLEWRLHPASPDRLPLADTTSRWIVVCSQSYTSSLAAAALVSLGVDATDLIGGFEAWQSDGLPTVAGPTRDEQIVGRQPPATDISQTAPER